MDYLSGWCRSEKRLEGYTIIVTGSNTGVGRETAADLYRRGACVIMACRNIVTAKEAKEDIEQSSRGQPGTGELVVEELELCSLESVRAFCARVTSSERRLRGVVCNAGVMMCPAGRSRDGFETHLASNHLGHALLTLLLLPLLIQSAPSRIVFVSSRIHQFYILDLDDINFTKTQYTPLQAYSNSKIANILFAKALDLKLKEHNIQGVSTYSLHPGIVKTDIGRHFPQTAWSIVTYGFQNFLLNWCWKTPRCGAQTSIYCAVDEKCENESGFYYSDCAKTTPSRQCQSESEAEKLWNVTIELLNLQDYDPFRQDSSKEGVLAKDPALKEKYEVRFPALQTDLLGPSDTSVANFSDALDTPPTLEPPRPPTPSVSMDTDAPITTPASSKRPTTPYPYGSEEDEEKSAASSTSSSLSDNGYIAVQGKGKKRKNRRQSSVQASKVAAVEDSDSSSSVGTLKSTPVNSRATPATCATVASPSTALPTASLSAKDTPAPPAPPATSSSVKDTPAPPAPPTASSSAKDSPAPPAKKIPPPPPMFIQDKGKWTDISKWCAV